ncbi:MAG: amidohydrolase [Bryobacteraceae bacterium]|nr:amidohydrolase [Bryobacteraceae bacterium]
MLPILVPLALVFGALAYGQVADLVVENALIYTVDAKKPKALALAVKDGKFIYVGDKATAFIGPSTQRIDAKGAAIIPGMIDSHTHLRGLGDLLTSNDFRRFKSPGEIALSLKQKADSAANTTWITGRNWDQANWGDRMPGKADLDAVLPNHPVFLRRVDGHAGWANSRALAIARVTRDTPDPPGGQILKDAKGEPTGILVDRAMALVTKHIPPATPAMVEASLARAAQECARLGITGIHDAGIGRLEVEAYRRLVAKKALPVRAYAMVGGTGELWDEVRKQGPVTGDHFSLRAIKLVSDGAMGSRGAAFWQPYSDDKSNSGLLILSKEQIAEASKQALDAGFQVAVHAIGDKANSTVLEAFAEAFKAKGITGKNDKRFRIEHAQVIRLPDFALFGQYDVIASIQSTHATSDMRWAAQRLGPDRLQGAWATNRFLKAGARIANGSDFPVEDPNPIWGFYAAFTRQDHQGNPPGGFLPDQVLSRERALQSFTLDGAYASFEENLKGSITVGKLADFVMLDRDIMSVAPKEVIGAKVKLTVLGGEVVYRLP